MASVKIYVWNSCPFCIRALSLLDSKGVQYESISLDGNDQELQKMREKTGQRTVPMIFINDEFIGGYSEMAQLDAQGELDKKLQAPS